MRSATATVSEVLSATLVDIVYALCYLQCAGSCLGQFCPEEVV